MYFNPRTREGCDRDIIKRKRRYQHFNPRTREGCDASKSTDFTGDYISIHAPARGATHIASRAVIGNGISIHAPARGATTTDSIALQSEVISIHAPARGATCTPCGRLVNANISIHAPARGATDVVRADCPLVYGFQSTHPRGVRRQSRPSLSTALLYFNPRTREGCDFSSAVKSSTDTTFQSTHPRGVRPGIYGWTEVVE